MAGGVLPRERIRALCARIGSEAVVQACVDLVAGRPVDAEVLVALGGRTAPRYAGPDSAADHWPRVWGLRGLLWQWDDVALPAVRAGLADDAWRVREMAAKEIGRAHV